MMGVGMREGGWEMVCFWLVMEVEGWGLLVVGFWVFGFGFRISVGNQKSDQPKICAR